MSESIKETLTNMAVHAVEEKIESALHGSKEGEGLNSLAGAGSAVSSLLGGGGIGGVMKLVEEGQEVLSGHKNVGDFVKDVIHEFGGAQPAPETVPVADDSQYAR